MKQAKFLFDLIKHYLSDKRHIAVGQHYKINELRGSPDYVTSWRRLSGETIHYEIMGRKHKVEMWQEKTGYYECIAIRDDKGKNVDGIEVRL